MAEDKRKRRLRNLHPGVPVAKGQKREIDPVQFAEDEARKKRVEEFYNRPYQKEAVQEIKKPTSLVDFENMAKLVEAHEGDTGKAVETLQAFKKEAEDPSQFHPTGPPEDRIYRGTATRDGKEVPYFYNQGAANQRGLSSQEMAAKRGISNVEAYLPGTKRDGQKEKLSLVNPPPTVTPGGAASATAAPNNESRKASMVQAPAAPPKMSRLFEPAPRGQTTADVLGDVGGAIKESLPPTTRSDPFSGSHSDLASKIRGHRYSPRGVGSLLNFSSPNTAMASERYWKPLKKKKSLVSGGQF